MSSYKLPGLQKHRTIESYRAMRRKHLKLKRFYSTMDYCKLILCGIYEYIEEYKSIYELINEYE
jgi:hypothetical protein